MHLSRVVDKVFQLNPGFYKHVNARDVMFEVYASIETDQAIKLRGYWWNVSGSPFRLIYEDFSIPKDTKDHWKPQANPFDEGLC